MEASDYKPIADQEREVLGRIQELREELGWSTTFPGSFQKVLDQISSLDFSTTSHYLCYVESLLQCIKDIVTRQSSDTFIPQEASALVEQKQ